MSDNRYRAVSAVMLGIMVGLVMVGLWIMSPRADAAPRVTYRECSVSVRTDCVHVGQPVSRLAESMSFYIGEGGRTTWLPRHIARYLLGHRDGRTEYMPCEQEDQTNCVWDARHEGNGMGQSFFTGRDGRVWDLPHHIAHYLIGLPTPPL